MSKKDKVKHNDKIESNGKVTEAIEVLKVQLQKHSEQSEYHKMMATKAQGALEVLLQLHPDKEAEEMVVNAGAKEDHQEASIAN